MPTPNRNTDSSVYFVLTHGCPPCPRTERNSLSIIKLNFLLEEESDTVGVCFNAGNRLRERLLYVPLCLVGNIGRQRICLSLKAGMTASACVHLCRFNNGMGH